MLLPALDGLAAAPAPLFCSPPREPAKIRGCQCLYFDAEGSAEPLTLKSSTA
jgi:hypothetical protein